MILHRQPYYGIGTLKVPKSELFSTDLFDEKYLMERSKVYYFNGPFHTYQEVKDKFQLHYKNDPSKIIMQFNDDGTFTIVD